MSYIETLLLHDGEERDRKCFTRPLHVALNLQTPRHIDNERYHFVGVITGSLDLYVQESREREPYIIAVSLYRRTCDVPYCDIPHVPHVTQAVNELTFHMQMHDAKKGTRYHRVILNEGMMDREDFPQAYAWGRKEALKDAQEAFEARDGAEVS